MTDPGSGLYELLPTMHRVRDAENGQVLEALLAIVDEQRWVLEDDIARLYDNWFIETCEEWVVPYIGDLLSVRGLLPATGAQSTERGVVANTIAYRRRKGTAAVLEQLARDLTGWPARAVEFFQLLATTQFMNHVRPQNVLVDLRQGDALELIGSPFDSAARTADVRHIDNRRGKHNIPNLGLFLWRLQSYRLSRVSARAVPAATPTEQGRYTFSPLGTDAPLFNLARSEDEISHLAFETDVPGPIRRRPLAAEIRARRNGSLDLAQARDLYFGDPPVVEIYLDGSDIPVPPEEMSVCDLSDPPTPLLEGWRRPSSAVTVGIDPRLGRLALPATATATSVEVSYAYGFSGDVGGGPYDRRASVAKELPRIPDWQIGVTTRKVASDGPAIVPTLSAAIAAWQAASPSPTTSVIAIMDSRTYAETLPDIDIPAGRKLLIVAADWPKEREDGSRRRGRLAPTGRRPHVEAELNVRGLAPAGSLNAGELLIDGLLIEGSLKVKAGNLGALRIAHTTLVPKGGTDRLVVEAGTVAGQENSALTVDLDRSISGRISIAESVRLVRITDSIVDGVTAAGVLGSAFTAGASEIRAATILGDADVMSIEAENSIFVRPLIASRRQVGCVRYSYLPPTSLVPRRFRCVPDGTTTVVPRFTSMKFGDPGYGQLANPGPQEIVGGAEGDGEMGAFNFLDQPRRLQSVRSSLDEYLRLGLEAGIFFVT